MMKQGLVVIAVVLGTSAAIVSCVGDDPSASADSDAGPGGQDGGPMTSGDGSPLTDGSTSGDGAGGDADAADAMRPIPPAKGDFGWVSSISKADTNGAVAFDGAGNAYYAFGFYGPIVVDGTHNLTNVDASGNTSDIGLVKIDPMGHVAGAWSFGATGNDYAYAVAVDSAGDVYVTGNYSAATFAFGNNVTLTRVAGADPYVLKVRGSDGVALWAQDFATATTSYGLCTHLAFGAGRVAVRCYATADLSVKLTSGASKALTPIPNSSAPTGTSYFAELDPATGKAFWATAVGTEATPPAHGTTLAVYGLAVDATGAMVFTASAGAMIGDTIHNVSGTLMLTYAGASGGAMIVGKLSAANGEGLWLKGYTDANASNQTAPGGVATDSMNDVIIGGEIRGTVSLGAKTVSSSGANFDAFIAKLDSSGTTVWARPFGGTLDEDRPYVAVDPWDQIFAAGSYKSNGITIDSLPALPDVPSGAAAAYLVKLDGTSKALWAKGSTESGTSAVAVKAVSADPFSGGAAVAGYIGGTSVDFGNGVPVTNAMGSTTFYAFGRGP